MAPKIYKSKFPDVPIYNRSIFTHLFSSNDPSRVGDYPGSDVAFVDAPTGTTLTRAQTKSFSLQLALSLRTHPTLQARRGETVLIYSQNSLSWPVALFGSVAAGLRCTLANSAYNARELAFQYTDSGARIVFTSEEGIEVVLEMFKELGVSKAEAKKRTIVMATSLSWAGGANEPLSDEAKGFTLLADLFKGIHLAHEERFDGVVANETVYLCYSSGTTGKPKGVETTHRNVTAVLDMTRPIFPMPPPGEGPDRVLAILPFYHIYGAINLIHLQFMLGNPMFIMPRFDPMQFLENIQKYKITAALIVPPILVLLARLPFVDNFDLSTLTYLTSGAAPLGASLAMQVKKRLESKRTNGRPVYVLQGYGLTETSPTTHMLDPVDCVRKIGAVGVLLPNLEARLVVDGDGEGAIDAKSGESAELWLRGPSVMKGYHKNKKATDESITPDGWFKTGDIAILDPEGFYSIVDRRKELIKYKGFQVPPAELESVLLTHPEIADAAVIGVNSEKEATELPRAYVVCTRPDKVETDEQKAAFAKGVQQWIRTKVAKHKFLRGGVVVIDMIPKSAAGKILRRDLRERAAIELGGRDPADSLVKAKL